MTDTFDARRSLGFLRDLDEQQQAGNRQHLLRHINLQLITHGQPHAAALDDGQFADVAQGLLDRHRSQARLLSDHRCPVDARIENFIERYFSDLELPTRIRLPAETLVVDQHGMARELALPADGDEYHSNIIQSYRVRNGVLHNPRHDRRTTQGTFHIAEGGLPIPGDKRAVPKRVFAELLKRAFESPTELLRLPFTSNQSDDAALSSDSSQAVSPGPLLHLGSRQAACFVSLLLRPIVCPEVPGVTPEKSMEIRFFAPGMLVSNLDFVESIFGNAGDPYIPENDSALDVEHWSGHTGAVILAPHLEKLTKKELGLPHYDDATERRRRDDMCWRDEDELYNGGQPFKVTCRDESGVIITLISDNYFGYCKKEVKTQISFATNLSGNYEEEHAGGAVAFPSYGLGDEFQFNSSQYNGRTIEDVFRDHQSRIKIYPEGYAVDLLYPDLVYVKEDAKADTRRQRVFWMQDGVEQSIPLLPRKVYMGPSGYRVRMEKHPAAPSWRLVGTVGEGVLCHKPCTVSGGGKSEISKSIRDYMHYGPIFVSDIEEDFALAAEIFDRDYQDRWAEDPDYSEFSTRNVLSPRRTLGSVIKLLTPSPEYTDDYNSWLAKIPNHVYAIVCIIKRFYREEWGDDWRSHFGVDVVNGELGHELKYLDRQLVGTYLRVGMLEPLAWRTFKVRQDFIASEKLQVEDDITAAVVVPSDQLEHLAPGSIAGSYKFVTNCEYRFFQRPDDAILRGLDKQTEFDLSQPGNFISNFEPLTHEQVADMSEFVVDFDAFSRPMQKMLSDVQEQGDRFVVCSANPRQIDGKPTRNPRYLQDRPDMVRPMTRYVAEMGTRLARAIPLDKPVHQPVGGVLIGRRNNPPNKVQGIRGLAVYNPIHYQELPELLMDLITSLTGRSPSTTGFGSEGALTKSPFNALRPTADLNSALVSFILTDLGGFSTAAGHIGPNVRVGHDISLLIPEVWCRMTPEERDPNYLIKNGMLELVEDFEHNGRTIPAGRLGYRITDQFVRWFFGRVFDNPNKLFDNSILRPEIQDVDAFADGILYITEAQQQVAQQYFEDGSIEDACPPLKALLTIMAQGSFEGKTERDPEIRNLFTRDALLNSAWYQQRLQARQQRDVALWSQHVDYLGEFMSNPHNANVVARMNLEERHQLATEQSERVAASDYAKSLIGTIGAGSF
jgi:phosphoenolpyruvate carboxykinase (diphosphate)